MKYYPENLVQVSSFLHVHETISSIDEAARPSYLPV
jgi:hypothetical protein